MNKTKEIIFNIAMVFCGVVVLVVAVLSLLKVQDNERAVFETNLSICVENSQLTEYEQDKLDVLVVLYINRDTYEMYRVYNIDSFNNWLKYNDYDFWYDINYIFE